MTKMTRKCVRCPLYNIWRFLHRGALGRGGGVSFMTLLGGSEGGVGGWSCTQMCCCYMIINQGFTSVVAYLELQ